MTVGGGREWRESSSMRLRSESIKAKEVRERKKGKEIEKNVGEKVRRCERDVWRQEKEEINEEKRKGREEEGKTINRGKQKRKKRRNY